MRHSIKKRMPKRKTADQKRREAFQKLIKEAEDIRDPILEELEKEADEVSAQIMELNKVLNKNPFHEERQRRQTELIEKYNSLYDKMVAHIYNPNNPFNQITPSSGKLYLIIILTSIRIN